MDAQDKTPDDEPFDLLVKGGAVLDVVTGRSTPRDLAVARGRIAPGSAAARSSEDASGCTVVPLVVETIEREHPEAGHYRDANLDVGHDASFAVVSREVAVREARSALVVRPPDLRAIVLGGRVAVRDGDVVSDGPLSGHPGDAWTGDWRDRSGHMVQSLGADGRYDETRGGRPHAWTGRFWVAGERIVYLDDTGFWAFGRLHGQVLHHAGFVMQR